MRQMYLRRWSLQDVAPGADDALCSWPIPNECILNSVEGTIHVNFVAAVDILDCVGYAIEGWMLQTDDIATDFADQTAIWDTSVPKDDGSETLDSGFAPQVASVFEPGLMDAAQLFDQELLAPHRVFQVSPIITLASRPVGFIPGSPSTFHPSDVVPISITKRYKNSFSGAFVMGAGSPAWDVSSNNDILPILGPTHQISMYAMAHIDDIIDKAMIDFLLLTEAGATTPYDDVMTWLMALLDQVQEEQSVGSFTAGTITFASKLIAGIAVPGTVRGRTLGPDMQAR